MSCISSDEIVKNGTLAQVVEQWTENPCVLGSTPRGTTSSFHLPPVLFGDERLSSFYNLTPPIAFPRLSPNSDRWFSEGEPISHHATCIQSANNQHTIGIQVHK